MSEKHIYVHFGLERTGTTLLQKDFFPTLKGIDYIPKNSYYQQIENVHNLEADKVLFSREFDETFHKEVERFAKLYPDAHPIITFRPHSSWLLSKYKRHIKVGYGTSIDDYFDVKEDKGFCKQYSLEYFNKLGFLKDSFSQEPLVLIYDELSANPEMFMKRIVKYLDLNEDQYYPQKRTHVSYSKKQLRTLQLINARFNFRSSNADKPLKGFNKALFKLVRIIVLNGVKLVPNFMIKSERFYPDSFRRMVDEKYLEDWKRVEAKGINL